jgi:hypothetical protein
LRGGAALTLFGYSSSEAFAAFERARDLAQKHGLDAQRFRALDGLWPGYNFRGEIARGLAAARAMAEIAAAAPDPERQLIAGQALAACCYVSGRYGEALPALEQALAVPDEIAAKVFLARRGAEPKAICLTFQSLVLLMRGDPDGGAAALEAARRRAEASAHLFTIAFVGGLGSSHYLLRRAYAAAAELAASAGDAATRGGFRFMRARDRLKHEVAAAYSAPAQAEARLLDAVRAYEAEGSILDLPLALALGADALLQGGQPRAAARLVELGRGFAKRVAIPLGQIELDRIEALIVLALEPRRAGAALELALRAHRAAQALDAPWLALRAARALAEVQDLMKE